MAFRQDCRERPMYDQKFINFLASIITFSCVKDTHPLSFLFVFLVNFLFFLVLNAGVSVTTGIAFTKDCSSGFKDVLFPKALPFKKRQICVQFVLSHLCFRFSKRLRYGQGCRSKSHATGVLIAKLPQFVRVEGCCNLLFVFVLKQYLFL